MNVAGHWPQRGRSAQPQCRSCRHFVASVPQIEAQLPGMRALGSGYGSVRATDGICRLHQRYLSDRSSCESHVTVNAGP